MLRSGSPALAGAGGGAAGSAAAGAAGGCDPAAAAGGAGAADRGMTVSSRLVTSVCTMKAPITAPLVSAWGRYRVCSTISEDGLSWMRVSWRRCPASAESSPARSWPKTVRPTMSRSCRPLIASRRARSQ